MASVHSPEIFVKQPGQAFGAVVELLQQPRRHLQVRGSLGYPVPHALKREIAKTQPPAIRFFSQGLNPVMGCFSGLLGLLESFVAPGSKQKQLARGGAVFFRAGNLSLAQDGEVASDGSQQREARLAGPLKIPETDHQGPLPAQLEKYGGQAVNKPHALGVFFA